jgi:hypothetical protein
MCAQPDKNGLSVMHTAQWSIAIRQKLRLGAHRLIVWHECGRWPDGCASCLLRRHRVQARVAGVQKVVHVAQRESDIGPFGKRTADGLYEFLSASAHATPTQRKAAARFAADSAARC